MHCRTAWAMVAEARPLGEGAAMRALWPAASLRYGPLQPPHEIPHVPLQQYG